MNKVAVVGAGAWGTALALHAARTGAHVSLWSRSGLRGRESRHLPGFPLPGSVAEQLPDAADLVILATPTQHLRTTAAHLPAGPVLLVAKGVETGTGHLALEILAELHPNRPAAVLSGPNFAHEVAADLPAAAVVASHDPGLRTRIIELLGGPSLRLYASDDPVGVQLGGAAKNVVAIAAGVVMGAGLGENARAALITRGLAELRRLVEDQGGRPATVTGLSGLGDLLLTCTGGASRNYRCGLELGRGTPLATILADATGVIEGIATAPALLTRAGGLDLPVCRAVDALLTGTTTPTALLTEWMRRPVRDE